MPVLDLRFSRPEVVLFVVNFHLFCDESLQYHETNDFSYCAFLFLVIIVTNIAASEVGAVLMTVYRVWLLPTNNMKLCLLCPV